MNKDFSSAYFDHLVAGCCWVIPFRYLQIVLGCKRTSIEKSLKRQGIDIPREKRLEIRRHFDAMLPDLLSLPLTEIQKRSCSIEWQRRHFNREKYAEKYERIEGIILKYSSKLPSGCLRRVFGIGRTRMMEIREDIDLVISKMMARNIFLNFIKLEDCPVVPSLTREEKHRLWNYWNYYRKRFQEKQSRDPALEYEERIRYYYDTQLSLRREYFEQTTERMTLPCICCREDWPQSQMTLTRSLANLEGEMKICKSCAYKTRLQGKLFGRKRKNRKSKCAAPSKDKEARAILLLKELGYKIPTLIWERFFECTEASLARLRKLSGVELSMPLASEIKWRWYFDCEEFCFSMFNAEEQLRIKEIDRDFRSEILKAYSRDAEFEQGMIAESNSVIRLKLLTSPGTKVESICCRKCKISFVKDELFFKVRKSQIQNICLVCIAEENAKSRLQQNRKRFSKLQ